jgi:ATP-dependent RNA helicase DDX51/DBP6
MPYILSKSALLVFHLLQALQHRVVCQVRALVVLPVRDLVTQVHKVFLTYCKHTNIKVTYIQV